MFIKIVNSRNRCAVWQGNCNVSTNKHMEENHLWYISNSDGADFVRLGTIFIAAEALGNPSGFQVGFGTVLSGGATLTAQTNDGVGSFYMITKQQQTLMTVNIRPDFQTGYVKGRIWRSHCRICIGMKKMYWFK